MSGFKDVKGYEGEYAINNKGQLYSYYRNRLKTPLRHDGGYVMYGFRQKGQKLAHRLVAEAFIPNPKNKEFVNHKNGIKTDNRVENLEWVTRQENEDHAFRTGLKNSTGENNQYSKLTNGDVSQIKQMLNAGTPVKNIVSKFCVCERTIYRIKSGHIWSHVKVNSEE